MKENSVKIHVDELTVGMKIRIPAKWIEHPFWRNKITIKSCTEIQVIKKLNINHVDLLNPSMPIHNSNLLSRQIEDNLNVDSSTNDQIILSDCPDIMWQENINLRVEESKVVFGKFTDLLDEITNLIIMGNVSAKMKFYALASDLVEYALSGEKRDIISISSVGSYYPSTQYAISSASFSIVVAKSMNSPTNDLIKVCRTALLLGLERLIHLNEVEVSSDAVNVRIQKFIDDFDSREIIVESFLTGINSAESKSPLYYSIKLCRELIDFFNSNNAKSAKILLGIFFKRNTSITDIERRVLNLLVKSLGIYPPGTYIRLKKHSFAKVVMSSPEIENPYVIKCSSVNSDQEILQLADIRTEILELLSCKDVPLSVAKKLNVSMQNYIFI